MNRITALWIAASVLGVCALTTIDVPPFVVFTPPPAARLVMGALALLAGIIAMLYGKKPSQ